MEWAGTHTPTLKAVKGSHRHSHHTHTQLNKWRVTGVDDTYPSALPPPPVPPSAQERICISPADDQSHRTQRPKEERTGREAAVGALCPTCASPLPLHTQNAHRYRVHPYSNTYASAAHRSRSHHERGCVSGQGGLLEGGGLVRIANCAPLETTLAPAP